MNIIDRITLNRLISIITSFILSLAKIFAPKAVDNIDVPKPKRKKIFPWRINNE